MNPNLDSRLLHLGCGLQAPTDWLNVDGSIQAAFVRYPRLKKFLVKARLYPKSQAEIPWPTNVLRLDIRKTFPWPEGRFDAVYSSHTLEHLYRDEAAALLRESRRVLKSGGICRVVVPDLRVMVQRYWDKKDNPLEAAGAAEILIGSLQLQPPSSERGWVGLYHRLLGSHQHKWMYDAASLEALLLETGFKDVTHPTFGLGRMPKIAQVEDPSRVLNGAGIIAEGVKP